MILDGNEVEATGGPEHEAGDAASELTRSAVVGGAVLARRHAADETGKARERTAAADLAAQELRRRTAAEERTHRLGAGLAVGAALQPDSEPVALADHSPALQAPATSWDPEAATTAELVAQHFPRTVGSDLARAIRHGRSGEREPELVPAPVETVVELT